METTIDVCDYLRKQEDSKRLARDLAAMDGGWADVRRQFIRKYSNAEKAQKEFDLFANSYILDLEKKIESNKLSQ